VNLEEIYEPIRDQLQMVDEELKSRFGLPPVLVPVVMRVSH